MSREKMFKLGKEAFKDIEKNMLGRTRLNMDVYLNLWVDAKYRFFKLMGDKLIINCEIQDNVSKNQLINYYNSHMSEFGLSEFDELIKNKIPLLHITNNKINNEIEIGDKKFTKNTKISKVLGKIVADDKKDEILTAYSMFIQKIKSNVGVAHLSIDPRDYLTMSDNNHNWSSCQSLGDFHATATLSAMIDETTLIGYVTSDGSFNSHYSDSYFFKNFYWNSKKWRRLVHINENGFAVLSRQYPGNQTLFAKGLRVLIKEVIDNLYGEPQKYDGALMKKYEDSYYRYMYEGSHIYPDLQSNSGYFLFPSQVNYKEQNVIIGTENVYCLGCNKSCMTSHNRGNIIRIRGECHLW